MSTQTEHTSTQRSSLRDSVRNSNILPVTTILPNMQFRLHPKFCSRTSWIQMLYSMWTNLVIVSIGLAYGFPAVQVSQLLKSDSDIEITLCDAGWIASVFNLLFPIGCLLGGVILDKYGRKITLIISGIPSCIGWIYMAFAKSPCHIIIGRVITGVGCGLAATPTRIYCAEITLPNMRPLVGAFPNIALTLGITFQAGLGNFFEWQILCYISSIFTGCLTISYFLLPETPYYLLVKKNIEAATKSLRHFRSTNYDLTDEVEEMEEFKRNHDIRSLNWREKITALSQRSAYCPLAIVILYDLFCQMSGANIIVTWGVDILIEAKSTLDPYLGYFLLSITRLFFGIVTAFLLFQIGRKPVAMTSAIGVTVTCFVLTLLLYFWTEPNISPQICLMVYMAFATGFYTMPHLIMSEIYPLQIRGILSGLTVSMGNLIVFCTVKVYPCLRGLIGFPNVWLVFGMMALTNTMFIYLFLPETKGLTLHEIEEFFNKTPESIASQRRESLLRDYSSSSVLSDKDFELREKLKKRLSKNNEGTSQS